MFRQFVKNGIRKDENGYFCSLCICFFENEAATLSHCSPSNEFHNRLNLKRSFTVNQLPQKSEMKFKSLVYNYILKIDPFGYRCDICNFSMKKISQVSKHIKEARHVIEMNYKNINRFPECDSYQFQYVCKLCNVRYKEENPYKLHINGKRHAENLELASNMLKELELNEHDGENSSQKYRYIQKLLQGLSKKQDLSEEKYSSKQNLPKKQLLLKKQDLSKGQNSSMGHNFTKPLVTYLLYKAILKEEKQVSSIVNNSMKRILEEDFSQKLEHSNKASDLHRYCKVCNLNIYGTKEEYTLHLCGILHKSKLLLKKQQTQIQKLNRFCQFCNVQLSCQETLDDHLQGKSHLINLLNSFEYGGQEFDIESVSMFKFSNKLEKYACVSCDSIFSGKDTIIDHYFQLHNGCVAHTFFKQTSTNGLDTFQCSLCNIHSSGICDFLLHAQGSKHTQKFLSEKNLFKMNLVDYNLSVNGNHNEECSSNAIQLAHDINIPTIFICSFCGSSFSNKNSSLQHIEKPANGCLISSVIKLKEMKLFCVICSIKFDIDFKNLKQHLQSKRHGKKLAKPERTSLNNVDGQLLGKQILTENVHFSNHENSKDKALNDLYPKHESRHFSINITNTTTKYNCYVCNVTANNDLQLLKHINELKHKSILSTLPREYIPYIYCPFCHIDIFEDESMTNHLESVEHKNRLSDHSGKACNISQTQNLFDSLPGSKTIVDELCSEMTRRPRRPDNDIKKKNKVKIYFDSNYSRIFLELGESNIFNVDQDKLLKLKLGTELAFLLDNERLCLACYQKIPNNLQLLYEHFLNVHHIRKLDKLLQEDFEFENFRDQFSDLALAKEFMKEVDDTVVFCFACNCKVSNNDNIIREHANNNKKHKIKSFEHKQQIEEIHKAFTEQLHNAWYIVQRFSCQLCNMKFELDIDFAEHLGGKKHLSQLNKLFSKGNKFCYDLCIPCASMSLGISDTYTMHCEDKMHKYLVKSKDYSVSEMIKPARSLLSNVEEIAKTLVPESDAATSMGGKIDLLLKSLEQTVKSYYPEAMAYLFGSRASNLAFFESDVDVFLDCGKKVQKFSWKFTKAHITY